MADDTAVTGKPMDQYEPYVEMLSHVLANGIALTADREFLLGLDRTVQLHEAVRDAARDSIKWRFAFEIDRIEELRAGETAPHPSATSVATEEPEWEYRVAGDGGFRTTPGSLDHAKKCVVGDDRVERRTKEIPAGPWVPVEQGDKT